MTVTIEDQIKLLFLLLFFSLINFSIAKRWGFFKLPLIQKSHSFSLFKLLGLFFVFLFVQIVLVPSIVIIMYGRHISIYEQGWWNVISMTSAAFAVIGYVLIVLSKEERSLLFGHNYLRNFLIGMASWLIAYPPAIFVGQSLSILLTYYGIPHVDQTAVNYLIKLYEYPSLFWAVTTLVIFVVPAIEEILFRGFLQTWIRQYLGRFLAIFFASTIFTFFHFAFEQGMNNIVILSSLFILSCFLGFLYERQQSLFASIGLHVCFNAISVGMILLEIT